MKVEFLINKEDSINIERWEKSLVFDEIRLIYLTPDGEFIECLTNRMNYSFALEDFHILRNLEKDAGNIEKADWIRYSVEYWGIQEDFEVDKVASCLASIDVEGDQLELALNVDSVLLKHWG